MHPRLRAGAPIALLLVALLASASPADAFELSDPRLDRDAIAHRKDLFAQSTKLHACIVKAALTCEKGQQPGSRQCYLWSTLTPPTTYFLGVDPKGKGIAATFEAAVQKCIAQVDFTRKGAKGTSASAKYEALGCPGECSGSGQSCPSFADYQTFSIENTIAQASFLAGLEGAAVRADETDVGGCKPRSSSDPVLGAKQEREFEQCLGGVHARVVKYVAALQRCQAACEADYSGKKGGGGPVDGPPTCNADATLDPSDPFAACVAKADAKVTETPLPRNMANQLPSLRQILDFAVNGLFNAPGNCAPQG